MARLKKSSEEIDNEIESTDEDLELDAAEMDEDSDDDDMDEKPAKGSKSSKPRRKRKEPTGVADLLSASSTSEEGPKKVSAKSKPAAIEEELEPLDEKDGTEVIADDEVASPDQPETLEAEAERAMGTERSTVRRPRSKPEEKALSLAMESALEAMAKQWAVASETSAKMAENMERVHKLVAELPTQYTTALDQIFKQPPPRPTLVTKVAMGMSAVAIVLSFVSMSLSQSVRSRVFTQEIPQHSASTTTTTSRTAKAIAALAPPAIAADNSKARAGKKSRAK